LFNCQPISICYCSILNSETWSKTSSKGIKAQQRSNYLIVYIIKNSTFETLTDLAPGKNTFHWQKFAEKTLAMVIQMLCGKFFYIELNKIV